MCPIPQRPCGNLGIKWVGFTSRVGGGSTVDPEGVGEGRVQTGQRVWARKGHSARPEETVAQCLGLPEAHSGLLFLDSP